MAAVSWLRHGMLLQRADIEAIRGLVGKTCVQQLGTTLFLKTSDCLRIQHHLSGLPPREWHLRACCAAATRAPHTHPTQIKKGLLGCCEAHQTGVLLPRRFCTYCDGIFDVGHHCVIPVFYAAFVFYADGCL
jgi:hypothetical protein